MRIVAVCGMGCGSSLMLKLNIQSVLKDLGLTGVEVAHCDLASLATERADWIVVAEDLAASCQKYPHVIAVRGIMNKAELKARLAQALVSPQPPA